MRLSEQCLAHSGCSINVSCYYPCSWYFPFWLFCHLTSHQVCMAFTSSSSSHFLTPCFVAPASHSQINLLSWIWPYFQLRALICLYLNTVKHLSPWQPLLPWLFCFSRGTRESTWHSCFCHLIAGISLGSTSSSSLSILSVSQASSRPFPGSNLLSSSTHPPASSHHSCHW